MTGADPRRDNVKLLGGIGPWRVGSILALLLATAAAHPGWSQDPNVVQDPLDPAEIGQPPARLEYDVRVFGIPVGMVSAIAIEAGAGLVTVSSRLQGPFVSNDHTSTFRLADCEYRQISHLNRGRVLAWGFHDNVAFDWNNRTIDYRGRDEELRHSFSDETFVDKLSQYEAIACRLRQGLRTFTLSYVDRVVAHYTFEVVGHEIIRSPAGKYRTVKLAAKPRRRYGSRGPYRVEVTYWLAPALGLYPAKIRTASAGPLRVTAVLKKVSRDVEDRGDGEDGNPGP